MANGDKHSKKELKELRKLEQLQSRNLEKKQDMVKWVAISVISLVFLAFFIGLVVNGKNKNKPQTVDGKAVIAEGSGHIRMGKLTDTELLTNKAKLDQAAITLVEYADFQCPACKAYHPVVKGLLELYPDQVKLVFKHFPLSAAHKNAEAAAVAAEAAARQNKFFLYADKLYETQEQWANLPNPLAKFGSFAKELGLNSDQFSRDMKDTELMKKIDADRNEGIKNGVNATPSFFMNGEKFESPTDIEGFKKVIDEELERLGETTQVKQISPTTATGKENLPLQ